MNRKEEAQARKNRLISELGEEGYRAMMRERGSKSRRNPEGKGGFGELDPEQLIKISSKGGKSKKK